MYNKYEILYNKAITEFNIKKGRYEALQENYNRIKDKYESNKRLIEEYEKLKLLFQKASENARQKIIQAYQQIVTGALQYILGEDYSFEIELGENRGKPELYFYVVEKQGDKLLKTDPLEQNGGGIVDIISFTLRICSLLLFSHQVKGPIILDEPGKYISEEYIQSFIDFLKYISSTYDRQIIMVTHQPAFAEVADNVIYVKKEGKYSKVITSTKH